MILKPIIKPIVLLLFLLGGPLGLEACEDLVKTPKELSDYAKESFMQKLYDGEVLLSSLNYDYRGARDWQVYSDRKANKTYASIGGSQLGTLDYMQKLYVKEVSGSWLRVVANELIDGELICTEKGWINASYLVLSSFALLDENGLSQKALNLLNLKDADAMEEVKYNIQAGVPLDKYMFYYAPGGLKKNFRAEEKALEIRYVLKRSQSSVLLSKNDDLVNSNLSDNEIILNVTGWASNGQVTPWNTRVCLEVQHGKPYSEVYKDRTIPFFMNERDLNSYFSQNLQVTTKSLFPDISIKEKRMSNSQMRFPVIRTIDSYKREVAAIATYLASKGEDLTESGIETTAKITDDITRYANALKSVNILFVIDATGSMDDYYQAIQKGLGNIIEINKDKYKKELKIGVAVYRDFEDGKAAYELLPLSGDMNEVRNYISQIKAYSKAGIESVCESQYQGIVRGVKECGFNHGETNIVVLIGDAGNHRPSKTGHSLEDAVNAIASYGAQLITFQVGYKENEAYSFFKKDALAYITKLADKTGEKYRLNKLDNRKNAYELEYFSPTSNKYGSLPGVFFSRYVYANLNAPMDILELQKNLAESMDTYLKKLEEQLALLKRIKGGQAKRKERIVNHALQTQVDQIVKMLREKGWSEADIKNFIENNNGFSINGFTSTRFYDKDYDCYKTVIFMSDGELNRTLSVFASLDTKGQSTSEVKESLTQSLLAQVLAQTGEEGRSAEKKYLQLSLEEIWQLLFASPFDERGLYSELSRTPLGELIKFRDNNAFRAFTRAFTEKLKDFNSVNLREDRFELNDSYYYWIPLEKFPGNG